MANVWTIRRAEISDAPAMGDLHVRSWQAAYRGIVPDKVLDAMSVESRIASWRAILTGHSLREAAWVAFDDCGAAGGIVSAGPSGDDGAAEAGEVYVLYLLPATWGTGLAEALFSSAMAWLRLQRFEQATLWVFAENARARRFYEREGWSWDGATTTANLGGRVLAELRYARSLSTPPT
jgi:GNAT superfamily N-acetyltransferase